MFKKTTKKEAVYSSTDFSDVLSSPTFYSVIALTFILGVSSIFGFLNNPRALKTVVDVISQQLVSTSSSSSVTLSVNEEYALQKYSLRASSRNKNEIKPESVLSRATVSPYRLPSTFIVSGSVQNTQKINKAIQTVSFDYDIASKQFWGDFDIKRLESLIEEGQILDQNSVMIGAPLSSEYYSEQSDDKYSMGAGLLRL